MGLLARYITENMPWFWRLLVWCLAIPLVFVVAIFRACYIVFPVARRYVMPCSPVCWRFAGGTATEASADDARWRVFLRISRESPILVLFLKGQSLFKLNLHHFSMWHTDSERS